MKDLIHDAYKVYDWWRCLDLWRCPYVKCLISIERCTFKKKYPGDLVTGSEVYIQALC